MRNFRKAVLFLLWPVLSLAKESRASHGVNLKLYTEVPGYDLQYESIDNGKTVKLNPNFAQLLGLRVGYGEWFSFGYGFKLPQAKNDLRKGDTRYDDWRFSFAFRHFLLSFIYQEFQGFYYADSRSVNPAWTPGQDYEQSPNLKLRHDAINLTYIWSPDDFSLSAALDQSVRQTKSGGSLLLGFAASQTDFRNDGPIIPSAIRDQFGEDQNIQSGRFQVFTVKAGYGYSLVFFENWFTSVAAQIGGGQQRRVYKDASSERHGWHTAAKMDVLLSTGYNGDRYFSGVTITGDSTTYQTTSIRLTSNIISGKIFVGGRF